MKKSSFFKNFHFQKKKFKLTGIFIFIIIFPQSFPSY